MSLPRPGQANPADEKERWREGQRANQGGDRRLEECMAVKLGPEDLKEPNPRPKVKMVGEDGNAFAIMGRVRRAFQEIGRLDLFKQYEAEAIEGNYDHLLATTMKWCDCD